MGLIGTEMKHITCTECLFLLPDANADLSPENERFCFERVRMQVDRAVRLALDGDCFRKTFVGKHVEKLLALHMAPSFFSLPYSASICRAMGIRRTRTGVSLRVRQESAQPTNE